MGRVAHGVQFLDGRKATIVRRHHDGFELLGNDFRAGERVELSGDLESGRAVAVFAVGRVCRGRFRIRAIEVKGAPGPTAEGSIE